MGVLVNPYFENTVLLSESDECPRMMGVLDNSSILGYLKEKYLLDNPRRIRMNDIKVEFAIPRAKK